MSKGRPRDEGRQKGKERVLTPLGEACRAVLKVINPFPSEDVDLSGVHLGMLLEEGGGDGGREVGLEARAPFAQGTSVVRLIGSA